MSIIKLIGLSFLWIGTLVLSFSFMKKISVQIYACKTMFFIVKIACLLILPFLLFSSWLYEPLWEQFCLLVNLSNETANSYKIYVWWVLLILTLFVTTGLCIVIFRRNKGRILNTPSTSSMNDRSPKDAPIHKWEDDILHRDAFVEVLKTAIMRADVRNGAEYIGVFGEWGTGKTSVINLLKHDIKAEQHAVVVDFDPWDFRSADDAVDGFMRVIADVAFRSGAYAVGDSFSDYLQVLRLRKTDADYGSIGLVLEFIRWKFYYLFLNSRRHKLLLKRRLRLMPRRIVVVLDDLERLPQEDVSEILRTIKTNLNLPNLVFVIVSSKRHLIKASAHYLGAPEARDEEDEKECLLKIVQYQFSLPAVPQSNIMDFFKKKLAQVLDESGYSYGDYNVDTDNGDGYETANKYIHTLRAALLLSNSVWEALAYLCKLSPDGALNVHVGDLVALCAIRLIDEKFYSAIPNLFAIFADAYANRLLLDNQEVSEKEFNSWIVKNTSELHRDCDIAFLKARLGLEESHGKNGVIGYSLQGFWSRRQEMLSEYRLASPECYREYFFDFSAIRRVSKRQISDFTSRICELKPVSDMFNAARKRLELPNLILSLEGLPQFSSDEITLHYFKQLFVLAGANFADSEYSYRGLDGFQDNIYTAIWRCLVRYCGKYVRPEKFSNMLSNIVYAGGILFDAIKSTPEPHLIWRWLSYEHGNYERDRLLFQQYGDKAPDFIVQSSLFSWSQYEALQSIYLDIIEKYQKDGNLFADVEMFDLLRAWNICLRAKNDERRYATFQSLISGSLSSISNVQKLIVFVNQSEVRFGDALHIGEVKFLPVDCPGAARLWGKDNLERISATFSSNSSILNPSQRAFAKALQYVIDNNFDPVLCDNEHQISFIKHWLQSDRK